MASLVLTHPDAQYRLTCVQLYNWGTFNKHHTLRVPRQGLLLTGQSGSGKSSLLDAISTVLVPKRDLKYNVAAQDSTASDRSRSVHSYVRGAYRRTTDDVTGELRSEYLRPGNTHSAIALTFQRLAPHDEVTLIALFHARAAAATSREISTGYIIVEGEMSLEEFIPHLEQSVNLRAIRKNMADRVTAFDAYNRFSARFRRRLGLTNEVAQRLLHKTQSAKNLTSLDTLLRDFMLDEPDTFKDAAAAVEQFAELSDAHRSVIDARHQEEVLLPLRQAAADIDRHKAQARRAEDLKDAIEPYVARFKETAYRKRKEELQRKIADFEEELDAARLAQQQSEARLRQAQRTLDGLASAGLGELQARLEGAQEKRARIVDERDRVARQLDVLAAAMPTSRTELAELHAACEKEIETLTTSRHKANEKTSTIHAQRSALQQQITALREQVNDASANRSAMSHDLLRARGIIARDLGVAAAALPFVGEVMELASGSERWRVAAEAVAGGFARTMVVPDYLYRRVAEAVDSHNLRTLLTYERVLPEASQPRRIAPNSLARHLVAKEGTEVGDWLNAQISQRFTHTCVENAHELAQHDRAVTLAGQVKGSASRHRKDDRRDLTDPRNWTIGVDPTQRIDQLLEELTQARKHDDELQKELGALRRTEQTTQDKLSACQRILETQWELLDLTTAQATVTMWEKQIAQVQASQPDLARAKHELDQAKRALDKENERIASLRGHHQSASDEANRVEQELAKLAALRIEENPAPQATQQEHAQDSSTQASNHKPTAGVQESTELAERMTEIDNRIHAEQRHVGLEDIDSLARKLSSRLEKERADALDAQATAQGEARSIMTRFSERWSTQAANLRPELPFLADYLTALDTLQSDGLPKHERRFAELLATQSRQNIGRLAQAIRSAVREVIARIAPVNEALRAVEYAPGHHLRIEVTERRFAEAEQFLADLSTIASGNLAIETESREEAEARFATLNAIMTRLASSEPADLAWQRTCLDTRRHVTFRAVERDATGRAVNYYEGASGLSGGQRQKLVIFCLAAALRYQLAGPEDAPSYCLVVLDEAFDKTDADFTRAGLSVFRNFGFQLLLATPMTKIQIMEPYVGGATMVSNNEEGNASSLHPVLYHDDSQEGTKAAGAPDEGEGAAQSQEPAQDEEAHQDGDLPPLDLLSALDG